MSHRAGCLVIAALFVSLAGAADADPYRILSGRVEHAATGEQTPLGGSLELEDRPLFFPFPLFSPLPAETFVISDFALMAAGQTLTPSTWHTFDGLYPSLLRFRIPDALSLQGGDVVRFVLRAGGDVVSADTDTVTFRDWNFVGSEGAVVLPAAGDADPPQRFRASGQLSAHDTTYRIVRGSCPPIVILPPRGIPNGPVILPPSGGVTITAVSISSGRGITLSAGSGTSVGGAGTIQIVDVGGLELTVDGSRGTRGEATAVVRTDEVLAGAIALDVTLEALGITAPDGAEIQVSADGHVTVSSEGDLLVEGGLIDIEGMTRLSLLSSGSIIFSSSFQLADGVALDLDAAGDAVLPGDITLPPDFPVFCPALYFDRQETTLIGDFELEAALELPVGVDILPRRIHPARRRAVAVAILGSETLDVRDVLESSLRFGPGGAEPVSTGRRIGRRRDANRDGFTDLIVRFATAEAGIAFGDTEACLLGETTGGLAIAGCDAIDASPLASRTVGPEPRARPSGPPDVRPPKTRAPPFAKGRASRN